MDEANSGTDTNKSGIERTHPLMLGKRWGDRAEENIEKWGNQRHDTLLLALIEEVGEIAIAMEEHNAPSDEPHPYVRSDESPARGRRLIHEMAELGRDTRDFLEANYEEPAGSEAGTEEFAVHGEPKNVEPILNEVEDSAPLCFQLYWALNARSVDTDTEQTEANR